MKHATALVLSFLCALGGAATTVTIPDATYTVTTNTVLTYTSDSYLVVNTFYGATSSGSSTGTTTRPASGAALSNTTSDAAFNSFSTGSPLSTITLGSSPVVGTATALDPTDPAYADNTLSSGISTDSSSFSSDNSTSAAAARESGSKSSSSKAGGSILELSPGMVAVGLALMLL